MCPACWSSDLAWIESSGRGKIYSFTIVHRASTAEFQERVPYALAMITLNEGPRMVTNIAYEESQPLEIDDVVEVFFEERSAEMVLPQFRRAGG